jgi:hypothetical protein
VSLITNHVSWYIQNASTPYPSGVDDIHVRKPSRSISDHGRTKKGKHITYRIRYG